MSSSLVNPSIKAFDFASNDVLCSYDDFNLQNGTNKVIPDSDTAMDFSKDFQRSRMTSCSPCVVYNQPDDDLCQATLNLVEKCMKRHSDDIMRILQGISSRLSHLEQYCYNVDKSVGEIHLNLRQDYEETDARLASLDKHLEEVSQSIQILREKQEFAQSQKVLAKLQLAQKEFASPDGSHHNVNRSTSPSSDHHKTDDTFEAQNKQLAIVLRHQVPPQQQSSAARTVEVQQHIVPSSQVAPQHTTQDHHDYLTSAPYQVQVQAQGQYFTSGTQYHTPQSVQPDLNGVQFHQVPAQVIQAPLQAYHFIHPQQHPQHMISGQVSMQQPPTPAPSRPQSASSYPPYGPSQSLVQVAPEAIPTNMYSPLSGMPQQVVSNGYDGGPVQMQLPSQHIHENSKAVYGGMYKAAGPHHSLSPANVTSYVMYGNEEVKRKSHFPQGSQPPVTGPWHVSTNCNPAPAQYTCANAHNELIDKLVNLGFRAEHVVPVIQKMEESREAVDYNSVLGKLNVQAYELRGGWTG